MIPDTVLNFLHRRGVEFEIVSHPWTVNSQQTAQAAHVPGDQFAKAVVLEDGNAFVLAVLPASHQLVPSALIRTLARAVQLADEADLSALFRDCRPGAVPPLGDAYGVTTVVDDSLLAQDDVWFEAGDHEHAIHVGSADFARLMRDATHSHISRHE
ncbi:MAG: YbaK/EbsC family protein [Kofleriaceae bacterium]|nr:YbaK/EbsC family protein [Myxococcales bacterium]MCB9563977.1 YbaK/EbsC family protein [Kofleriaceae bacterium]